MNPQQRAKLLYSTRLAAYMLVFMSILRYHKGVTAFLNKQLTLEKQMRVLDAGVGEGTVVKALYTSVSRKLFETLHIDAFDITPVMLTQFIDWIKAEKLQNVTGFEADVLALPPVIRDNSYDIIFSSGMLEYLSSKDFPSALHALAGKLQKKGRLILFIAKKTPLNALLITLAWKAQTYAQEEVEKALKSTGLQAIVFHKFPKPYAYLNRGMFIVEASF